MHYGRLRLARIDVWVMQPLGVGRGDGCPDGRGWNARATLQTPASVVSVCLFTVEGIGGSAEGGGGHRL